MANYYDEYRNDLYNPDDGHDTKKPGRNANWKAIQKGFKDTQGEIDRLDGRVDELEERVETAEEHVANLEERVSAEETINREQQVQIDANTAKNAEQDTRLDGIDIEITTINNKDTEQDARLDDIEADQLVQNNLINEHGNRLTAHDASIADINTRISHLHEHELEQDADIEDLQTRMTAVEAEQEVERQEHAEIKQNIEQIQRDIGTHDRLIAQNAQNIANNAQAIQDEATNRVNADNDLRARIDANAQAIQDETDARETADQRIEDKVDAVREEFDECCEEVKTDITRINAKDAEQDTLLADHGRRLTADEQMLADHGDRITALEGRTTQNEADITTLQAELDAKSAALDAGLTPIASVKDGTTVNQVTDDAFNAMQNEEVDVYGNVEGVLKKVEYVVTDANTITVTGVGTITKSGNEYSISWASGVSNADISLCEKGLIASDEKVEAVAQELGEDIAENTTAIQNLSNSMRWKNGSGANAVQMIAGCNASGAHSVAEGGGTTASNTTAHAEGSATTASGSASHAEGSNTKANGDNSHAEGGASIASENCSHAEGSATQASGAYSHAEGSTTIASGISSHAEGQNTRATGVESHSEGNTTIANHKAQHVFGEHNIADTNTSASNQRGDYVEIVGNGTSNAKSNARTLDWNGNETLAGNLTLGMGNDAQTLTKEMIGKLASEVPTTRDSQTVANTRDTTIGDSNSNFNVEATKDANGESMTFSDTANGDSVSVGFTSDANGDSIDIGGKSYKQRRIFFRSQDIEDVNLNYASREIRQMTLHVSVNIPAGNYYVIASIEPFSANFGPVFRYNLSTAREFISDGSSQSVTIYCITENVLSQAVTLPSRTYDKILLMFVEE